MEIKKKNILIVGVIAIIVVSIIAIIQFTVTSDEKEQFIAIWQYSDGGAITFNENNTALIDNVGPLRLVEINGVVNYEITNNHITFSRGSLSYSFNYNFPNPNKLVLTNSEGSSLTLIKM